MSAQIERALNVYHSSLFDTHMIKFPELDLNFITDLFDANFITRHKQVACLFDLNIMVEGRTLLYFAIEREDLHMVTLLLRMGADPNLRAGHANLLPIGLCLNQGRLDICLVLIAFGARFDYFKSDLENFTIQSEFLKSNYPYRIKELFPS